jgi:hypothetical protein
MKNRTQKKEELLINLGVIFRQLRIKKGYSSAEQFSYDFDLNRTAYWRENGENITMLNFIKLCTIYDVSPKEIFELYEKKYKIEFEPYVLNEEFVR